MAIHLHDDLAQRGLATDDGGCEFGDVSAAAKVLGVSPSFLNKARMTGNGPPYLKLGGRVRYHLPSVVAWALAQTRRSTSQQAAE
jgi:hypothetical protein